MSMNEHETHAAVVAEMRGTDNKCQFATKDGTGCYHCPFGSAASNCLFDKFANRAEAAHKREVEKLNSVIQATVSRSDAEIDRLRCEVAELRKQIGNAAAMREALVTVHRIASTAINDFDVFAGIERIRRISGAALSKPPRQCDVGTAEEQAQRYQEFCDSQDCDCIDCPVQWRTSTRECPFTWAQMPYEEGGAK